jgi:[ribosomal protein S5]-alanine N-acetyltransferase
MAIMRSRTTLAFPGPLTRETPLAAPPVEDISAQTLEEIALFVSSWLWLGDCALSMEKSNPPPLRLSLQTDRLVLRPSGYEDASRAIEILSDWGVSRMLSMATFPPNEERLRQWFHEHRREWADGAAYRFAILHQAKMIGLVDIEGVTGVEGVLGYWLEQSAWGHGFAFEAATAAVNFAFETVGLSKLRAAHAFENGASGGVLRKLGFRPLDSVQRFSHSRREDIIQRRYILTLRAGSR